MADRRRSRVRYDDAEPLPLGQSESERKNRWSEDRGSWSRDAHDRPRERAREDHRRPSWRDRDYDRPWSGRNSSNERSRYRDDYGHQERSWGDHRSYDHRSSQREQSPDRPRSSTRESTWERRREDQRTDTPLASGTDESEADQMAAMMGFGSFGTSKGKQVEDNAEGFAEIKKEHSWRQYMNRKGGFNRPLDKVQ